MNISLQLIVYYIIIYITMQTIILERYKIQYGSVKYNLNNLNSNELQQVMNSKKTKLQIMKRFIIAVNYNRDLV